MYDVIIIGSGPAGISASLYTQRANLKTLIITKRAGTIDKVGKIENYYGFPEGITGKELSENGIKQAKELGVTFIYDEVVNLEQVSKDEFTVETINSKYTAKTIILATGTARQKPQIKGVKELEGRGISYCATCDAFFFRGKDVAILGSGEYAIHEAEELQPIVNSITLLTNGEKLSENRSPILQKIKIEEKQVREFRGENKIQEIAFEDATTKNIDGVFIAIGTASSSDLARKIGIRMNESGRIIVNSKMETNVKNVFACGDCTEGMLQIAKAVYDGMVAGMTAIQVIREKNKNI